MWCWLATTSHQNRYPAARGMSPVYPRLSGRLCPPRIGSDERAVPNCMVWPALCKCFSAGLQGTG